MANSAIGENRIMTSTNTRRRGKGAYKNGVEGFVRSCLAHWITAE